MLLEQRLSRILIPSFSLVVFSVSFAIWLLMFAQARESLREGAELKLENAQVSIERLLTGVSLTVASAAKKTELFGTLEAGSGAMFDFALNATFLDIAAHADANLSDFSAIYALDAQLKPLARIRREDLRSFSNLDTPKSLPQLNTVSKLQMFMREQRELEAVSAYVVDNQIEIVSMRIFSPEIRGDTPLNWARRHFFLLTIAKPSTVNELIASDAVSFELLGPTLTQKAVIRRNSDNQIELKSSLLELYYPISFEAVIKKIGVASLGIALVGIICVAVLYFSALHIVVKRVLEPIQRLRKNISRSVETGEIELSFNTDGDISEIDQLNNQYLILMHRIQTLANVDTLTGLVNRTEFVRRIDAVLGAQPGGEFVLLYFDLDRFKQVNDYYGHAEGDLVITLFAELLKSIAADRSVVAVPKNLYLSRLAGDEFALFLPRNLMLNGIEGLSNEIFRRAERGYTTENGTLHLGVSIGVAYYPNHASDASNMLANADEAMFEAKNRGRNRCEVYNREIQSRSRNKRALQKALEQCYRNQDFYLVYQPIFRCSDMSVHGVEVLVRSSHPILKTAGTQAFIKVAETNGTIQIIDKFVIKQVLAQIEAVSVSYPELHFSVNISASELGSRDFIEFLKEQLGSSQTPLPLEFEITETTIAAFSQQSAYTLAEIGKLGIGICLDDFGVGYNSFLQLRGGQVGKIKIDQQFVAAIDADTGPNNMVDIVLGMATLYELASVAEGIETEQQLDYVRSHGAQLAQGYLLAKPMVWDALVKFLAAHRTGITPR